MIKAPRPKLLDRPKHKEPRTNPQEPMPLAPAFPPKHQEPSTKHQEPIP